MNQKVQYYKGRVQNPKAQTEPVPGQRQITRRRQLYDLQAFGDLDLLGSDSERHLDGDVG